MTREERIKVLGYLEEMRDLLGGMQEASLEAIAQRDQAIEALRPFLNAGDYDPVACTKFPSPGCRYCDAARLVAAYDRDKPQGEG